MFSTLGMLEIDSKMKGKKKHFQFQSKTTSTINHERKMSKTKIKTKSEKGKFLHAKVINQLARKCQMKFCSEAFRNVGRLKLSR